MSCPNCGHNATDDAPSGQGESWSEKLARISAQVRREELTGGPMLLEVGQISFEIKERRGRAPRLVTVDVLHETDRRGRPHPERRWFRYPDGRLERQYDPDEPTDPAPPPPAGFTLPTAMQARANSGTYTAAAPPQTEPISTDPNDYTAGAVAVDLKAARKARRAKPEMVEVQAGGTTILVRADEVDEFTTKATR